MQALQAGARSHQQKALGRASCSRSSVPVVARPQALRQTRSRASRATIMAAATKPQIMVNSVAGKMGTAVAEATLRAGLELVPYTLCATEVANANKGGFKVAGVNVMPLSPEERDARIADIRAQYPNLVMVDYTVPDVIHAQADFYNRHKTPFVMGTTGGDRARLLKETEDSKNFAVIAPNMGKQIVAFQAMFEYTAATFPGAFAGYKLRVVESHQSTKKDTSGTAKAVVASLQKLGLNFDVSQIELVRDPKEQVSKMKVPEDALNGHAFHTYQLVSGDGSVMFEFQHNVVGRTTYAEGTVDACIFLHSQVQSKAAKTLYNMVDVLKAGAMR